MRFAELMLIVMTVLFMAGCQGEREGEKSSAAAPSALAFLVVGPADAQVSRGEEIPFTATGVHMDYTTSDLTAQVVWKSSEPAVAGVENSEGVRGRGRALEPGVATVTASLGDLTGWTTVTVSASREAAANVLPVSVTGVVSGRGLYFNRPTVSVNVCTPGIDQCQRIDDILLDTGSTGLRIFRQVINVPLPQVTSSAVDLAECVQYADGSTHWGPVKMAGVRLGGEPTVQVPIQVIDAGYGTVPSVCGKPEPGPEQSGYNGILGVGLFSHDCGSACARSVIPGAYYGCRGPLCSGVTVSLENQVQNPVAQLPIDNNGIIVQLPKLPVNGATRLRGQLVLGIGTRSNNIPSAVAMHPADRFGEFVTTLNGTTDYPSFIDSGSNALFFSLPPGEISLCSGADFWYCPPEPQLFSAVTRGAGQLGGAQVPFHVDNIQTLIGSGYRVLASVAGTFPGGRFDWGLPFFFGRNVYVGIQGKPAAGLGDGPFWAY